MDTQALLTLLIYSEMRETIEQGAKSTQKLFHGLCALCGLRGEKLLDRQVRWGFSCFGAVGPEMTSKTIRAMRTMLVRRLKVGDALQ